MSHRFIDVIKPNTSHIWLSDIQRLQQWSTTTVQQDVGRFSLGYGLLLRLCWGTWCRQYITRLSTPVTAMFDWAGIWWFRRWECGLTACVPWQTPGSFNSQWAADWNRSVSIILNCLLIGWRITQNPAVRLLKHFLTRQTSGLLWHKEVPVERQQFRESLAVA